MNIIDLVYNLRMIFHKYGNISIRVPQAHDLSLRPVDIVAVGEVNRSDGSKEVVAFLHDQKVAEKMQELHKQTMEVVPESNIIDIRTRQKLKK